MGPDHIEWPSRLPTPLPMERVKPIRKRKQEDKPSDESEAPVSKKPRDEDDEQPSNSSNDDGGKSNNSGRELDLLI